VWLVVDLLEQGEREAVEAQVEAFSAGAERLRQPVYAWHAVVWRAMLALLAGRLDEAEALSAQAVAAGAVVETVAAPQYYAIQSLTIRREQGRIAELEQPARAYVAANPDRAAWRAALAYLLLEGGRRDEAQELLDAVAAENFDDVPRDSDWLTAMTVLTDVAVGLGDAPRAERLLELLKPYARQNVVVGLGVVCLGACSRYLGRLAATMGRPAEAREYLEHALEANRRLGATVEVAHTELDLATSLGPGPRARELVASAGATAERLELAFVARRAAQLDRL
jgi:tetratricopeptide (TPR) repeat protein